MGSDDGRQRLTPWRDGEIATFSAEVSCNRCGREGAGIGLDAGHGGYLMVCVSCLCQLAEEVRLADLAERHTLGVYLRRVMRAMERGDQEQAWSALSHLLEVRGWDEEEPSGTPAPMPPGLRSVRKEVSEDA